MSPKTISAVTLARILDTSYQNFHAKGVDYVCLRRSLSLTLKIYFFDVDQPTADQVVYPHDHRYDFNTAVIRGEVTNTIWTEAALVGEAYGRFTYRTPLNGGNGFTYADQCHLVKAEATRYTNGQQYRSLHETIHTLNNVMPGTILAVEQYADKLEIKTPTTTYVPVRAKRPTLDGLYDRFTEDALMGRLRQLEQVSPGALSWIAGVE